MGLKYNKNDGQLLSSALKHNLEIADQIVEDVQDGVDHLLSMIDDPFGPLEGQAYHAAATLFQEIVKPTLSKLKEATTAIEGELRTFDYERSNFDTFPDPVYDMDDLKEHLEIKKQQKATVDFQMNLFNNQLANAIAKKALEDFVYEGQRLQGVSTHYGDEIKEIEDKLRILEEFNSHTSSLFQESLHTFQNAMNGAKALKIGSFDSHGNFSMPSSSDLAWYKKITGKDISRDLLHEPSRLTASDIEEQEVASMNAETKVQLERVAHEAGMTTAELIAMYENAQRASAIKTGNALDNIRDFISKEVSKLHPDVDFEKTDFSKKTDWNSWSRERLEGAGVYFNSDGTYVLDAVKVINNIINGQIDTSLDKFSEKLENGSFGNGTSNTNRVSNVLPNKPVFNAGLD